jgi:hypothetical protein
MPLGKSKAINAPPVSLCGAQSNQMTLKIVKQLFILEGVDFID